jgi:hypothetical protein
MARSIAVALVLLLAPGTVFAGGDNAPEGTGDWRGAAIDALKELGQVLDRLENAVGRVPSYGAPFLDDKGNIIIPRRGPKPARPVPDTPTVET